MAGLPGIQRSGGGYVGKAAGLLSQSAQTFSQQDRVARSPEEEKSAGGLGMAALSGAAAGSVINVGWGTAIGAVVGAGAYMLG